MAARVPKSEEQKFQTRVANYDKYHKDKAGVSAYTDRVVQLFLAYVALRRKLHSRGNVLHVSYKDGGRQHEIDLKEGNLGHLKDIIVKEIKDFKKIFTWAKKRQPQPKKAPAMLTTADIKGNLSPTILGPAFVNFVQSERIVAPTGQGLVQTLRTQRGGQQSLLEQGFALGTVVTNLLFLAANSNGLQKDPVKRSNVTIDAAMQQAFGGNIPALYNLQGTTKVLNDQKGGPNTFRVLATKARKPERQYDASRGVIPTQAFQEIKAINVYTADDIEAGRAAGGAAVAAQLNDTAFRQALLNEYKVVAEFMAAWTNDPNTKRAREAISKAQQQKRAKSPRRQ